MREKIGFGVRFFVDYAVIVHRQNWKDRYNSEEE